MSPLRIFISSVQKEFAQERAALRDYLRGNALMRRFFDPFLVKDVPAADRRADEVYQTAIGAARATVKRDLEELVRVGLVKRVGAGRGASYVLAAKRLTIGSIGSSGDSLANGAEMARSAQRAVKPAARSAHPASPPASGKGSRGRGRKRP